MMFIPVQETALDGANDLASMTLNHPMVIHRVEFWITTAVAADMTAPVLAFDYTPSGGSRTEYWTITLADGAAAGTVDEPDSAKDPLELGDGDQIHMEVKTAGADAASVAGEGYWVVYYEMTPDLEVA